MSFFRSNKGTATKPQYTGISGQTSASTLPRPLCWGMIRITGNLIWYDDFTAHKQTQKTGKGGGSSQSVSYTYSASVADGLTQGPVAGAGRAWKDQSKYSSYTELGFTLFTGTYPQAPWGYLVTAHPSAALGYPGTSYLAQANYNLGDTNTLGNLSIEMYALRYNTGVVAQGDADPALVIEDFLTDTHYSVLFPASEMGMDSLLSGPDATTTGDSALQTYCRALGFDFSPALISQEPASTILDRWMTILNTALVWTGYSLKFIPYGDQSVTANGVTYLPDMTIRYNLTDKHYIGNGKADPLILMRSDPADAMNSQRVEISDRSNEYNLAPIEWKSQALIDKYGPRVDSAFTAHEVCRKEMGTIIAALIGQRKAYIRNTYKTSLSSAFARLEPMDIVTCTDPRWGTFAVRVLDIAEQDDTNNLDMTFEELPGLTSTSPGFGSQTVTNNPQNSASSPGPVNPPIIFEPRSDLSGGVAQVWAAVSGGNGTTHNPLWGGCFVWLSTDGGTTYQQIGQINSAARQGKLTATLASYGGVNPDTVHTASVDLSMSNGDLDGVTSPEAANAVTLAYVGGELFSYMDATLTSPNNYDLDGELYRGLYGTTAVVHLAGVDFARLDDNIFKFNLPPVYIGGSIDMKFQSYNIWANGLEDLSTCAVYNYTPLGSGFGTGGNGLPSTSTGLFGATGGT